MGQKAFWGKSSWLPTDRASAPVTVAIPPSVEWCCRPWGCRPQVSIVLPATLAPESTSGTEPIDYLGLDHKSTCIKSRETGKGNVSTFPFLQNMLDPVCYWKLTVKDKPDRSGSWRTTLLTQRQRSASSKQKNYYIESQRQTPTIAQRAAAMFQLKGIAGWWKVCVCWLREWLSICQIWSNLCYIYVCVHLYMSIACEKLHVRISA